MISFCTIVKNEEAGISKMLNSVLWCDEFIILDNGSTDRTMEILESYRYETDKRFVIIQDTTPNDLAYLRNKTKWFSRGEWIFSLDGDEEIEKKYVKKILRYTKTLHVDGYSFISRIPTETPDIFHKWNCGFVDIDWGIRLFRNKSHIQYEGKIHEMVDESIRCNGGKFLESGIPILHNRHLTPLSHEELVLRFNLEKDCNTKIENFQNAVCHHFRLGRDYACLNGDFDKALEHMDKCIEIHRNNNIRRNHYINFMKSLFYREKKDLSSAFVCISEAIFDHPDYPGANCLAGIILDELGYHKHADVYFNLACKLDPKHPFYKQMKDCIFKPKLSLKDLPIIWEGLS